MTIRKLAFRASCIAWALSALCLPSAKATLPLGTKIPGHSFKMFTGKTFNPSQMKGKVVILDFWATWCVPCKKAIPHYAKMYKALRGRGLELVSISVAEGMEAPAAWWKKNKPGYPGAYTTPSEGEAVGTKYDFTGLPTVYFIDRKGVIRRSETGFKEGDEVEIEKFVKQLLSEK